MFSGTGASAVKLLTDLCAVVNHFSADSVKAFTFPSWSNPPVIIFDIRALWHSPLSVRAPECQKLKMALNDSNSSNLEQLALKGLSHCEVDTERPTNYAA